MVLGTSPVIVTGGGVAVEVTSAMVSDVEVEREEGRMVKF